MAAIAYVTDEKMLEYHRYKGSDSIVFWRLSSKNFTGFKYGDLLFFLSKGAETKRSNEKGIVGYGCFTSRSNLSIDGMWRKYGTKTGYNTKNELYDAISKSCKSETLPSKINCLVLEKVMFFQSPVYLSQLGYEISNKLESFTYLDKNEGRQTLKILQAAQEVGIDLWSASQNENDDDSFHKQIVHYQIATMLENSQIVVSEKVSNRVYKMYSDENTEWINSGHYSFIKQANKNDLYYIYQPTKDAKESYYSLVGRLLTLKSSIEKEIEEKINLTVISTTTLNEIQRDILTNNNIHVEYVLD